MEFCNFETGKLLNVWNKPLDLFPLSGKLILPLKQETCLFGFQVTHLAGELLRLRMMQYISSLHCTLIYLVLFPFPEIVLS